MRISGMNLSLGRRFEQDFSWYTLEDPQGNQFCIAPSE